MFVVSRRLSYQVTPDTQALGFVQLPMYQDVNGVQPTVDWYASLGVSTRF